jgi:hypothetical protein
MSGVSESASGELVFHALAYVRRPGHPDRAHVPGRSTWPAFEMAIEPDASSAVYWMAAAALCHGSRAVVPISYHSPQPDARTCHDVNELGLIARGAFVDDRPVMLVDGSLSRGGTLDASTWPDGALAIAAMSAMAPQPVRINGLRTLRVKESDRIVALQSELRRIGCTVRATDDSIWIDPSTRNDTPAVIETYNDHRMAMAVCRAQWTFMGGRSAVRFVARLRRDRASHPGGKRPVPARLGRETSVRDPGRLQWPRMLQQFSTFAGARPPVRAVFPARS